MCDEVWVIKCKSALHAIIINVIMIFSLSNPYGDVKAQGLGLKSLYLSQGIQHVTELLDHIWKETTMGTFIQISLEYIQLELGINNHILQSHYPTFSALLTCDTWITNTWQFVSTHNISVNIDPPIIP